MDDLQKNGLKECFATEMGKIITAEKLISKKKTSQFVVRTKWAKTTFKKLIPQKI